jgi:xanthine dehydrogenase large subunit
MLGAGDIAARTEQVERWNAAHEHARRGLALTPVKFGSPSTSRPSTRPVRSSTSTRTARCWSRTAAPRWGRAAHEDAAGRGDGPGRAARDRAPRADPHRQGAQHVGHRGELRCRPQRRRGQGRLRAGAPRLAEVAGERLGADPADVRFVDGRVVAGSGASLAWSEVVRLAYFARVQLWAAASTAPRACTGTPAACRASRSSTSPTASRPARWRSTGFTGRTARGASTSCTTSARACRRSSTSARSRAVSCREPAG